VSFYENALKTTGSIQAASRGEARCRFVSTYPRAVSIGRDAKIASTAGGSINPRENNTNGAIPKCASDGHRHPRFFLLSHFQHTMYFRTTIQLYKGKIMQSQYTSSRTHSLQIRRPRFAPACRGHFRGEFRSPLLQVFAAARSSTERSIFVQNIFADLVDQPKIRHIYNL
jgi:hypothetical protein